MAAKSRFASSVVVNNWNNELIIQDSWSAEDTVGSHYLSTFSKALWYGMVFHTGVMEVSIIVYSYANDILLSINNILQAAESTFSACFLIVCKM